MPYKLPPREVVEILDAPPTPAAVASPDRTRMLLVDYQPYPPISLLARPFLRLGGLRIDPALGGRQRTVPFTGITIVPVVGTTPVRVPLPEGAMISPPVWSHDGSRFAFTRDAEDGIEVWVAQAATGQARPIPGLRVSDTLCPPYGWNQLTAPEVRDITAPPLAWMADNRRLLVRQVPPGRGPAPETPRVPDGPRIEETAGKRSQVATFQDLLRGEHDERLFEHFATTQLALVDVERDAITPVGAPGMIAAARFSPNGRYLLVTRLKRPFSYRVPFMWFARSTEVWDAKGNLVRVIADLPVSDEVPRQGVPTGPRAATWQEKQDATLLWVEALDDGDPIKRVPFRDQVLTLAAPFTDAPHEALKVTHRFVGWDWTDRPNEVWLAEFDRDRRWHTVHWLDLARPDTSKRVLFDLSVNDAYHDPGSPVYRARPDGERTMLQDGDWVYLAGRGASQQGDRPFLDRFNMATGESERLFHCDAGSCEAFVAFVDDVRDTIITRRESGTEPPNFYVVSLGSSDRRALTRFGDPHPQITGLRKELIRYQREDGVPLSGTLYLPPGYEPERDGRLPLLVWAYPGEPRANLTTGPCGNIGILRLYNQQGRLCVDIDFDESGAPFIALLAEDGTPVWRVP